MELKDKDRKTLTQEGNVNDIFCLIIKINIYLIYKFL